MGIGQTLGGAIGSFGGPIGSAIGAAGGALIESIPTFIETASEKENKRRLKQLQLQAQLGQLGLTEAEKQSLFSSAQDQIAGQLATSRGGIRAAGAAGMGGAGTAALQQAALAENQAMLLGSIGRNVEGKNLERKRELEDEIQSRLAAKSQEQLEVAGAIAKIGGAAMDAGKESVAQQKEIQGSGKVATPAQLKEVKDLYKFETDEEAQAFLNFKETYPRTSKYDASITGETK